MIKEKRNIRGYKISDKAYQKAMKMSKNKTPLASLIEKWVTLYGNGETFFVAPNGHEKCKVKGGG